MSSFLSRLRRHKLLLAFLPALIFLFCSVFYYEINHSFVAFCDTVFRNEITENTLNLHYTLENPEILNLSDPDVSFGSMNPEVLADSFSQQNIYLEKLFKFPKDWLSTKNRLTYDILTSAFSLQAEGEKYLLYDEPLGPSLGTQAQLPVLLAECKYVIIGTLYFNKCRPLCGTFYFFSLVRNPSGNSSDHGRSRFRSSGFGKGPILRSSSNT